MLKKMVYETNYLPHPHDHTDFRYQIPFLDSAVLGWSDLRFLGNSKPQGSGLKSCICLSQPTFVLQLFKILRSSTRPSALKIENFQSRVKILGWPTK
jgi:hypothetical protein